MLVVDAQVKIVVVDANWHVFGSKKEVIDDWFYGLYVWVTVISVTSMPKEEEQKLTLKHDTEFDSKTRRFLNDCQQMRHAKLII
ncbi:unnamed protein product [Caenorhabditis nigoni]